MLIRKHRLNVLIGMFLMCGMSTVVPANDSKNIAINSQVQSDNSLALSSAISANEQSYPRTLQYLQTILREYSDKVSEILFVMNSEEIIRSHKTILMIPYAWISAIEQQDSVIDEIIRNYITTHMQSTLSWVGRINWDKVSIGLIVVCLAAISVHLYKIERAVSCIDKQIKSNTVFWLCTLPSKMRQGISSFFTHE